MFGKKMKKKFHNNKVLLTIFILTFMLNPVCLASTTTGGRAWPWRTFLQSLITELTGPLPVALGTLGLAYVAYSMFAGNAGDGTKKGVMIVLAISIALASPTIISWVAADAGGLLIK